MGGLSSLQPNRGLLFAQHGMQSWPWSSSGILETSDGILRRLRGQQTSNNMPSSDDLMTLDSQIIEDSLLAEATVYVFMYDERVTAL